MHFDGVTQARARAVGLNVIDFVRLRAGAGQGLMNHFLLGEAVGGGESVGTAVLVDGRTAQHGQDGVAVPLRVGQPLERDHAAAFAAHVAVGARIER
ncbi:hypothetical protein RZS08_05755, partial [Arthrospira platensis SPKY1]|nr:hypothetical protein [Arthrospira platensis SPKY1]